MKVIIMDEGDAVRSEIDRLRSAVEHAREIAQAWVKGENPHGDLLPGDSAGHDAACLFLNRMTEALKIPGERIKCPHCGSGLLWSEDRGPNCDGCDDFNPETDLPNEKGKR